MCTNIMGVRSTNAGHILISTTANESGGRRTYCTSIYNTLYGNRELLDFRPFLLERDAIEYHRYMVAERKADRKTA